jgi:uncharacterized protein (DUF849 family)
VLLQACINGARDPGRHPAVPVAPPELARDAAACVAAGARSIHLHVRDGGGAESLAADAVGACVGAVRAAVPDGVEVGISTGLWICGGDAGARAELVAGWDVRPDMVSLNVDEAGWEALWDLLAELGVAVEAGLSSAADARALVASGRVPRRALVEPDAPDPEAAVADAAAMAAVLDAGAPGVPQLHHAFGPATWAVLDVAVPAGRDVRIGLEDVLVEPDGAATAGNAALVAAAAARYR